MGLPLGAIAKGVVAGAVGTLAMDLLWYRRYQQDGGGDAFLDWELSTGTEGFADAGAPAQVGRRAAKALLHRDLPDRAAATTNNVVHWATGTKWGAAYGIAATAIGTTNPALGLLLGPTAWGASYLLLGLAGIYEPIWEYDADTLAEDLSAHLLFGLATAATYRILSRR